jgi:hypothetical protein
MAQLPHCPIAKKASGFHLYPAALSGIYHIQFAAMRFYDSPLSRRAHSMGIFVMLSNTSSWQMMDLPALLNSFSDKTQ